MIFKNTSIFSSCRLDGARYSLFFLHSLVLSTASILFLSDVKADTFDATFSGVTYRVGVSTKSFNAMQSELESSAWWGNESLAIGITEAVKMNLGGDLNGSAVFGPQVLFRLNTSNPDRFDAYGYHVNGDFAHAHFGFWDLDTVRNLLYQVTAVDDGDASYSISGDRYVGKALSASLAADDPDGNGSVTGYTWASSSDESTWSTVGTESSYTLSESDEGKYLRLTVAYTDGENFSESVATSNIQAKDFTSAMAKSFAALKSNNLEIVNSYVKNSLLSSQQSCANQGVEIFHGKACIHANYFHTNRYTFGNSDNNSFQAHQTSGNYGFDYQVTDVLNIGLRYGSGTSGMDNDTNTTGISSQASVSTNHWGLKASYEGEKKTFISGYLGFTDFDIDLDRQSTTNDGTSTSANSSFNGDAYSVGVKIAKVIPVKSNAVFIPELSATYSTYEQPQISETGTGDLLTIERTDSQSLLMRIGGKAIKSLRLNKNRYNASVYLGAWYEFDPYSTNDGVRQVSAQFTESSAAAVSSSSQAVHAQKVNLETGGSVQLNKRTQLSLSGGLDLAADVSNSYVRGGVTWAF